MKKLISGVLLFLLLAMPPVRLLLESYMLLHMLVQLPLLIISGMLIGDYLVKRFPGFFDKYDHNGIPGILLVYLVTMYWMIPRAMDEALLLPAVEIFKYISLPFLAGIALRNSWNRLNMIG